MTTIYDPKHPLYLDEADTRKEMERVFDLCHGCRLCFKFCPSFPTLFSYVDQHEDQDAGKMTPAQQEPRRGRMLPMQVVLRDVPVHP